MSKILGYTHVDAGHVDHVPYLPENPEHEGLEQIRVADGIIIPPDVPAGTVRVITRRYPEPTTIAHLDCGHTLAVPETVDHTGFDALAGALTERLPDKLAEQVREHLAKTGSLACPECSQ